MHPDSQEEHTSTVEHYTSTPGEEHLEETVYFTEAQPTSRVDMRSHHDTLGGAMDMGVVNLRDYLMRPILSNNISWSNNNPGMFLAFNPWKTFLENDNIRSKLRDFRYVRGDLNVKITINASRFHYGKMIVAYEPLEEYSGLNRWNNFVTLSQMPYVSINPSMNETQEMTLPFFSQLNWMDWNKEDTYRLGTLKFYIVNQLRQANAEAPNDPDPIHISVFLWMSDPVIKLPTNMPSPQAGFNDKIKTTSASSVGNHEMEGIKAVGSAASKSSRLSSAASAAAGAASSASSRASEVVSNVSNKANDFMTRWNRATGDEYGQGAISKPASAIASYATSVANMGVPVVSELARATEVAVGLGGRIASFFGFSRPANVDNPHYVKPLGYSSLANLVGEDNVVKFTLDPKQEIPISTNNFGLSGEGDCMTFQQMFGRESFLGSVEWTTSDLATEKLVTIPVTPGLHSVQPFGETGLAHFNTMLRWATMPFSAWTGGMRFRFEIVCSNFHRGRFRIVYVTEEDEEADYNTNYTALVDITDTTEVVVKVGWNRAEPWLEISSQASEYPTLNNFIGTTLENPDFNGYLQLYVVNPISGPEINAPAFINVYCCASDDFEVSVPKDPRINDVGASENLVYDTPEDGDWEDNVSPVPQGGYLDNSPEPIGTFEAATLAPALSHRPHDAALHFGERFGSLRAFLKRYTNLVRIDANLFDNGNGLCHTTFRLPNRPAYNHSRSVDSPPGWADQEFYYTLLQHYRACFIGETGAVRYKVCPIIHQTDQGENSRQVYHFTGLSSSTTPYTRGDMDAFGFREIGFNGQYWQPDSVNPAIESEVPYYNPYNFALARSGGLFGMDSSVSEASNKINSVRRDFAYSMITRSEGGAKNATFLVACAAGEDYSLHWLHSAPVTIFQQELES